MLWSFTDLMQWIVIAICCFLIGDLRKRIGVKDDEKHGDNMRKDGIDEITQ